MERQQQGTKGGSKGVIQEGTQQRGQHREVAAKAGDAARR